MVFTRIKPLSSPGCTPMQSQEGKEQAAGLPPGAQLAPVVDASDHEIQACVNAIRHRELWSRKGPRALRALAHSCNKEVLLWAMRMEGWGAHVSPTQSKSAITNVAVKLMLSTDASKTLYHNSSGRERTTHALQSALMERPRSQLSVLLQQMSV
eukprot:CAMPEP_0115876468 /NCGR_PEP_ID=MMETSP0287-20121206/25687_1 /TAXON_ID=412157 /ORGANISM="Chrysochromulina rotalis, Strain UIO044" /LENGTH=153 /DNA_ID=CAMNT_0003331881 /DNA_START=25 /DNA_END=486 /DNA_ORIENTATION=+